MATLSADDEPVSSPAGRPAALTVLDAAAARRWAVLTRQALASRRSAIDALNVYPVPDSDTGTNLFLTLDGAFDGVRRPPSPPAAGPPPADGSDGEGDDHDDELALVAESFARALQRSARGNSGVILSQIVRGVAEEIAALPGSRESENEAGGRGFDGPALVRALRRADDLAWASVQTPADGTILTVSRAAVVAAERAGDDLSDVVHVAVEAAREALSATTGQLEALTRAGVVDAGGAGYVVLLETLERVVSEEPSEAPDASDGRRTGDQIGEPSVPRAEGEGTAGSAADGSGESHWLASDATSSRHPAHEVMYLLDDTDDERVARLRTALSALGESLLVVGGLDGLWTVHVHTDEVDAVLAAGRTAGRLDQVRVSAFDGPPGSPLAPSDAAGTAVVVLTAGGGGLEAFLESAGAQVVRDRPGAPLAAATVLDTLVASDARAILLLVNDARLLAPARSAASSARRGGLRVHLVETGSDVAGLAALALYDPATPSGSLFTTARAMAEAARSTRTGVVLAGDDPPASGIALLDRLLADGGELLTLVVGEQAPDGLVASLAERARRTRPGLEVTIVAGGQADSLLLLGVE